MQQPPLRLPNSGSFSLEPDRGRAHVAKEILTSEKSYIYNLELCLTAMYLPLKEKINANAHSAMRLTRRRETFATMEELEKIFSCLESLQKQHVKFCERLDQRVLNWTPESCIGDIFLQETAFFAEYVRYANQFSASSETLFTCRRRKAFNAFLEHLEFSTGVMLPSFLIMPIQRLPRYELLLKELLKYTEETSNDSMDIPIALKQLKKHTKKTNIAVHCTLSQVSAEFNREQLKAGIVEETIEKREEGQEEEANRLTPDVLPRAPSPEAQGSTVEKDSPEKKKVEEEGLGTLKAENPHRQRPKSMSLVPDENRQKEHSSLGELKLKEGFAPVAEEEELKVFNSLDSPARKLSRSREIAQEKTKRRRSLLLFATSSHNKEKNKPEKDKASSCSAFFVEEVNKEDRFARAEAAAAEAAASATINRAKRRSFRLTWSSFGDFKETIATSFQEFQKEEDMLQGKKHEQNEHLHLSSDGSDADLLHSSDSLDGSGKTATRARTKKEEKEAERERKKSARRSRDGSSLSQSSPMPSSASASSVATPTTPGRKLSRLMGSMLDMKRHNKEDGGEWKITGHDSFRDKIETQG